MINIKVYMFEILQVINTNLAIFQLNYYIMLKIITSLNEAELYVCIS